MKIKTEVLIGTKDSFKHLLGTEDQEISVEIFNSSKKTKKKSFSLAYSGWIKNTHYVILIRDDFAEIFLLVFGGILRFSDL